MLKAIIRKESTCHMCKVVWGASPFTRGGRVGIYPRLMCKAGLADLLNNPRQLLFWLGCRCMHAWKGGRVAWLHVGWPLIQE